MDIGEDRTPGDVSGETVTLQDEAFLEKMHDVILAYSGVDISPYKKRYLLRRIGVRERALNLPSHAAYFEYLQAHAEEFPRCLEELTINATEFLRDAHVFEVLKSRFLSRLVRNILPSPKCPLRMWSAGCASGEEVYSLAMLAEEVLRDCSFVTDYRIVATDVDFRALETEVMGAYPAEKVQGIPETWRTLYFRTPDSRDGRFVIKSALKSHISFERHNVLTPFEQKDFDVILCRNTLIYFTLLLQEKILRNLAASLRPGGFLVLGQVERLIGPARKELRCVSADANIFQKHPFGEEESHAH